MADEQPVSEELSPADGGGLFSHVKQDFLSSIVVFLVALPLCMGVAIASGVDPARGLITGIVGGLVVGFLAGAPLQVSGPAAGLFVIVFQLVDGQRLAYIAEQGGLENLDAAACKAMEGQAVEHAMLAMGMSVLICGGLQLVAGLLKLGQWFRAVSPAVIHGMLAGIGVLIFVSQFHVMLDSSPGGKGLDNLLNIPASIMKCEPGNSHFHAAMIGILTITSLFWQKFVPAKINVIPAPLVAVVVASIFTLATGYVVLKIQVPANLLDQVSWPSPVSWQFLQTRDIWISGAILAAVASAETLLCATALDKMHSGSRANYDRELAAQGIGNIVCGCLGALPMTGVIVRSSANVLAGGKTRLSAILHGAWILLFVVALPQVLSFIPKSCLGAILVYTGFKLVNIKAMKELWKYGWSELAIYLVTLTVIVVEDLLTGVIVGIVLAALKLLFTFSQLQTFTQTTAGTSKVTLDIQGAATFLRLPKLAADLERIPAGAELHVRFEHLDYIDHACLDLLLNWAKQHEALGGKLVIDWESLHAKFNPGNGQKLQRGLEGKTAGAT